MAILLADIGGTNARFRWLEKGKLSPLIQYVCDNFKNPYSLINQVLKDYPRYLSGIVLAGAGPLQKGKLKWTNRPKWTVSEKELQKKYRLKKVLVVNDVQAQGEGLKKLSKTTGTKILMTAGTGLGACYIINNQVIPGEVGQVQIDNNLKQEDFISGPGIIRLYHCFFGDKKIKSARKIEELRDKKDKSAQSAFQAFYQKWGILSARLATAIYATGGVFLWGGLIPKNEKDKTTLTRAYKKTLPKGLQRIPLKLITDKTLSFKGLAVLSNRKFGQS